MTQTHITFADKKGRPHYFARPTSPVVDTHTHLVSREYDIAAVLQEAAEAGVRLVVTPLDPTAEACDAHAALKVLRTGIEGADTPPNVRLLVGAHPYHAEAFLHQDREAFNTLLSAPLCAGIGEIGLDYTCDVPHEVQKEAFSAQLQIALSHNLPVELHIRDAKDDQAVQAHADALTILQEVGMPKAGVVLHCFTQGPRVMQPYCELGCTIAFGGALTFKKSQEIREAALACPLDQMVTETDAPYMAPEPLRGMLCRPAFVSVVADFLASLLADAGRASREAVQEALWQNAERLFGRVP